MGPGPRPRWAGKETGANPTDRGKGGVKRSLLTEGQGGPLGVGVAGANRPDMQLVAPTLYSLGVERPEPTDAAPQGLCLDTGYDSEEVRATLAVCGFTAHMTARGKEARTLQRQAGDKA